MKNKSDYYLTIIQDYGSFLEKSSLCKYFPLKTPESLLPYSKELIMEAIKYYTVLYTMSGNQEELKILEAGKFFLENTITSNIDSWNANKNILNNNEYWEKC